MQRVTQAFQQRWQPDMVRGGAAGRGCPSAAGLAHPSVACGGGLGRSLRLSGSTSRDHVVRAKRAQTPPAPCPARRQDLLHWRLLQATCPASGWFTLPLLAPGGVSCSARHASAQARHASSPELACKLLPHGSLPVNTGGVPSGGVLATPAVCLLPAGGKGPRNSCPTHAGAALVEGRLMCRAWAPACPALQYEMALRYASRAQRDRRRYIQALRGAAHDPGLLQEARDMQVCAAPGCASGVLLGVAPPLRLSGVLVSASQGRVHLDAGQQ